MTVYLVLMATPWSTLHAEGRPVSVDDQGCTGYAPVYSTRADALRDWPGAELLEIDVPEGHRLAGGAQ